MFWQEVLGQQLFLELLVSFGQVCLLEPLKWPKSPKRLPAPALANVF